MHAPNIEKALVVRGRDGFSAAAVRGYQRVYFGDEFCEDLTPSVADVRTAIRWCARHQLALTVVTPFCTEERFERTCRMIAVLPAGVELVCNDPGILAHAGRDIRRRGTLVFGRLLLKHKRDPRLGTLPCDPRIRRALMASNLDDSGFQQRLCSFGVSRVELDNSYQGYRFRLIPPLRAALHWPYVYMTATTECLFRPELRRKGCRRECGAGKLVSRVERAGENVVTQGKAEFYRHEAMPSSAQLKAWGVDRLVVEGGD